MAGEPRQGTEADVSTRIDTVRPGIANVYVLRDRGTVLIDPGGPARPRSAPPGLLALLGTPPQLDLIVVTHGYFDHIGASISWRAATGATLAVHRADAGWLMEEKQVWTYRTFYSAEQEESSALQLMM